MVFQFSDYRHYLRAELVARQQKNPAYSMRAFAAHLEITQSALSQILSGKKNLSSETASRLAQKLSTSPSEREYFQTLVLLGSAKSSSLKAQYSERLRSLNPSLSRKATLSVDHFSMIAEWYHVAIVARLSGRGRKRSVADLANDFGIRPVEALAAAERLERLGFVRVLPGNMVEILRSDALILSQTPAEALQHFHSQMLDRAKSALKDQKNDEKFVGSETFSVPASKLQAFHDLCDEFLNRVSAMSSNDVDSSSEVYHLGLQFFRVSHKKRGKK